MHQQPESETPHLNRVPQDSQTESSLYLFENRPSALLIFIEDSLTLCVAGSKFGFGLNLNSIVRLYYWARIGMDVFPDPK